MSSNFQVTSQQVKMIESCSLSDGIIQTMENDDCSYNDAVQSVLHKQGWEMRNVPGLKYKEFYNKETKVCVPAFRLKNNNLTVPVTDKPYVTNAFRVRNNGIHCWVEPNEWQSTYDCRTGKRLLKKKLWREQMEQQNQRSSLSTRKEYIY